MPYAQINGTELYYEDHGTPPATPTSSPAPTNSPTPPDSRVPTALFLHGWGTSAHAWDAQTADLAPDFRLVTVDWRGCGRSAHPATGNTVAANVADILALIDALSLDRPVLVGSSMGATFALEAALQAPDRIAGVVSVDGSGYWPLEGMADQLAELRTSLATDRAATLAAWVPTWFGPAASPELIDGTIRQTLASGTHIDALFAEGALPDPRHTLGGLTVPALFLHGDLDHIPAEVSRTLADLAPQGEFHLLENTGHMPHQERPAQVNALLRTALRQMSPRTALQP